MAIGKRNPFSPAMNTASFLQAPVQSSTHSHHFSVPIGGSAIDSRGQLDLGPPGWRFETVTTDDCSDGLGDVHNPRKWLRSQKWVATVLVSLLGLLVSVYASIDSPARVLTAQDLGVSDIVVSLPVVLSLVGFCIGLVVSGPSSEALVRSLVDISGHADVPLRLADGLGLAAGHCVQGGVPLPGRLLPGHPARYVPGAP
ncbi:hypothetical protein F4779DRAFT_610084 [Xylariaceae sp. FL0662B]|nr:hypothetical protein F4779DRAFT_610084 [Xylariaceae sp. FL0662B]